MIIRSYKPEDYESVINLLIKEDVEAPKEKTDFKGICIVAEDKGKIVGCVWALTGLSTFAYVDYFAIDSEYQEAQLGLNLIKVLDVILRKVGVKRYTFFIEPKSERFINIMETNREANRVTRLRDLKFYRREIT